MRRLGLGFPLLAVLWLAWPAAPAAAFEGVLKWRLVRVEKPALAKVAGADASADTIFEIPYDALMSLHGEAVVSDITVYAKGSKVRADGTGRNQGTYTITDLDSGLTQIVAPDKKRITEFSEQDAKTLQRRANAMKAFFAESGNPKKGEDARDTVARITKGEADEEPPARVEVVSLGRDQTISGMPTKAYEVKGGKTSVLGWVTSEHPEVLELLLRIDKTRARQAGAAAESRPKTVLSKEGLPVRVQTLDARAYTVEDLVAIEPKAVDDALFQVPAGFNKATAAEIANEAGSLKPPTPSAPAKKKKP